MSATPLIPTEQESNFADALSAFSVFKDLPEPVIDSICKSCDRRQYGAGDTVFTTGQFDAEEFFLIVSGRMRLSVVDATTGAMIIEEANEGAIFGLELSLNDQPNERCDRFSATAEEDVVIIAVEAESFRALAAQRPSLMRNIAAYLAEQLSTVRFDPAHSQAPPHQRVYAALLNFVERDAMTGQWRIERMPKHRHLADKAGVEETVTADAVASLIQEGVAQRDYPGMVINDISRLNELAS